ncbi:MAG: HAMP domain-containing sensor histidine kinase, partial [Campylobacterota bacterium]|nr:HAMP domain-containing sensor histidine kinase [Campylobacterota bacterium]
KQTNKVGYIALFLMAFFYLIFFLITLKRSQKFSKQIITPLEDLTHATNNLKERKRSTLKKANIQEIDILLENFIEMSEELSQLYESMEQKIEDEIKKNMETQKVMLYQSRHAAMGEMIGNIAHQWRQPLNAIGLLLQNIETAYDRDRLDIEYLQKIIEKGNKLTDTMSKTIDDFRNFFKPNKSKEQFKVCDAYQTARDIIRLSFQNNNIKLIEEIDKSVSVVGYANEFSQVLLNILSNAKDALMENKIENKQIKVNIFSKNSVNYITISDNAGGIPNNIIEKIFDPYFTTKDEGSGTGVGLYMSKTIIESNMYGKLKVKNSENGAVFTVILQ